MPRPQNLTTLDADVSIISKLDRLPNKSGELTYKELQAKFDEAANIIKDYINDTMLANIEDNISSGGGQMSGSNIVPGTITSTQLATNAVGETNIADYSVTNNKLGAGAVTAGKIDVLAVTNTKLASNSVTEVKIENGAVTNAKLAGSITANKIADNQVVKSVNGKQDAAVVFQFKTAQSVAFSQEASPTLTDYPYKATVTDSDVTANDKVYVEFDADQINEGIYAPITISYAGGFYIFAESAPSASQTINYTVLKA